MMTMWFIVVAMFLFGIFLGVTFGDGSKNAQVEAYKSERDVRDLINERKQKYIDENLQRNREMVSKVYKFTLRCVGENKFHLIREHLETGYVDYLVGHEYIQRYGGNYNTVAYLDELPEIQFKYILEGRDTIRETFVFSEEGGRTAIDMEITRLGDKMYQDERDEYFRNTTPDLGYP